MIGDPKLTNSSILSAQALALLLRVEPVAVAALSAVVVLFARGAFLVEHVHDDRRVARSVVVRLVANATVRRSHWSRSWCRFGFSASTLLGALLLGVEVVGVAVASAEGKLVASLATAVVVPPSFILRATSVGRTQAAGILRPTARMVTLFEAAEVVLVSCASSVCKVHAGARVSVVVVPAFVLLALPITSVRLQEAVPDVEATRLLWLRLWLRNLWLGFRLSSVDATLVTGLFIDKVVTVSAASSVVELPTARLLRVKVPMSRVVLALANLRRLEADVLFCKQFTAVTRLILPQGFFLLS